MHELNGLSLEAYFTYHSTQTPYREVCHERINDAALLFAVEVFDSVTNPECRKLAFQAIQQARMFAHQGATIDELKNWEYSSEEA